MVILKRFAPPYFRKKAFRPMADYRAVIKGLEFAAVIFGASTIGRGLTAMMDGKSFLQGIVESLNNSWVTWVVVILIYFLGAALITCVEWKSWQRNLKGRHRISTE